MGIDDLEDALESAEAIIDQGLWYLRDQSNPEESQVFLYELAHARSALSIAPVSYTHLTLPTNREV